ncbi:hypothetical protein EC968_009996 [Mortierella alpina]|nr:hypothetical protein EC968_009996 [Mortierella alpina]
MPPLSQQTESCSRRTVPSALDIPEVLHAIAILLDPSSLVAAAQVSHLWYNCCSAVLWGSITFQDWTRPGFSPHQLYAHADLVRTLEWCGTQPSTSSATVITGITPESLERFARPPPHERSMDPKGLAPGSRAKHSYASSSTAHHNDETDTRQHHYDTLITFTTFEAPTEERLSFACLNKLVGQCTNLQRLCLQGGQDGIHGDMVSAVHSLAYLQELELSAHRIVMDGEVKPPTVQDWIRGLDQLSSLSVRGTAFSFDRRIVPRPTSMLVTPAPPLVQQPTFPIHHLTLDTPALMNEACLSHLIQQFPLLESLNLPGGLAWNWSDAFITLFARSCPRLHSFSINSACFPSVPEDRLTALIIGLCTGPPVDEDASGCRQRSLRKFGARSCFVGDSTLRALQHHCPDLQVLDISLTRGQGLSKAGLYDYLMQAENLRHLEAEGVWIVLQDVHPAHLPQGQEGEEEGVQIDHAHGLDEQLQQPQQQQQQQHYHQQPEQQEQHEQQHEQQQHQQHQQLHQQQGVRPSCREWASRSTLRYLNIGFTSPDRSTIQCCHMYSLLATLTQLEHLQLSYTCLNLSAGAGFRQLKSLTRLRVLSIETCGYSSLSREDLVWMVKTWPKLERIYMNLPGGTKDKQFRAWLKEADREDVVIDSQQAMMYY